MAITDEHLHKLSLFDWHLEHGADYQKYALYGLGAGALASCFYGKGSEKRTLKHAAKFGAMGAGVGIAAVFLLFKAGGLISDKSHEIVRAGYGRGGWGHGGHDFGHEHHGYRAGNEAALGYMMDPVGAFRAGMRRGWGHGGGGGGWGHGGGGGGWGHGGHGGGHGHHGWGGSGSGGGGGSDGDGGGGGEGGDEEGGFGPEEPGHPHGGWHPEHHHHGWRR